MTLTPLQVALSMFSAMQQHIHEIRQIRLETVGHDAVGTPQWVSIYLEQEQHILWRALKAHRAQKPVTIKYLEGVL